MDEIKYQIYKAALQTRNAVSENYNIMVKGLDKLPKNNEMLINAHIMAMNLTRMELDKFDDFLDLIADDTTGFDELKAIQDQIIFISGLITENLKECAIQTARAMGVEGI